MGSLGRILLFLLLPSGGFQQFLVFFDLQLHLSNVCLDLPMAFFSASSPFLIKTPSLKLGPIPFYPDRSHLEKLTLITSANTFIPNKITL